MPKLAKRTGMHPKTVKARLKALRAGGVIEGPYFQPRPQVAGLHMSGLGIEGVHPRDATWIVERLAAAPEVETVVFGRDYVDVIVWHREPTFPPPIVQGIQAAVGGGSVWKSFSTAGLGILELGCGGGRGLVVRGRRGVEVRRRRRRGRLGRRAAVHVRHDTAVGGGDGDWRPWIAPLRSAVDALDDAVEPAIERGDGRIQVAGHGGQ